MRIAGHAVIPARGWSTFVLVAIAALAVAVPLAIGACMLAALLWPT